MKDFVLSPISIVELEALIKKCVKEGIETKTSKQNRENEDEFLTAEEAAQFLKVSLVSIHNWKRDKGLRFYRLGRSIRFKKLELLAFAEQRDRKRNG